MTKGELCNPTNSLVHITTGRLPLRTGVIPKGNKVFLDEIDIDDDGTAQQTWHSPKSVDTFHSAV